MERIIKPPKTPAFKATTGIIIMSVMLLGGGIYMSESFLITLGMVMFTIFGLPIIYMAYKVKRWNFLYTFNDKGAEFDYQGSAFSKPIKIKYTDLDVDKTVKYLGWKRENKALNFLGELVRISTSAAFLEIDINELSKKERYFFLKNGRKLNMGYHIMSDSDKEYVVFKLREIIKQVVEIEK